MIDFTKVQKDFIRNNLQEPESLIVADDINVVLDALDDLMLQEGFGDDDEPNDRGYEIEKIRDEIYMNN